jgi:filamentous hemagglutinin
LAALAAFALPEILGTGAVSTAARAAMLREAIPAAQKGRITMAVGLAEDANGTRQVLISTSERHFRKSVDQMRGEILLRGTGHAEADIVNFARQNGLKLLEIGATRPICPSCASLIKHVGAKIVTPLKVP